MQSFAPDFINSPYLIIDEKGWRLKPNAPEKIKKEFKKYMEEQKMVIDITEQS